MKGMTCPMLRRDALLGQDAKGEAEELLVIFRPLIEREAEVQGDRDASESFEAEPEAETDARADGTEFQVAFYRAEVAE